MKTEQLIFSLISNYQDHSRETEYYKSQEKNLESILAKSNLIKGKNGKESFDPFGNINFPFLEMGTINTIHLFGLDELIIFSYYWASKNKYKKVADLGANLGLHSIIMEKCGFKVSSFEPDPYHVDILVKNINNNNSHNIFINQKAISDELGKKSFIRVLGNTTGSHLAGAKDKPYGDLEKFEVETVGLRGVLQNNDFIKMDIEGQEAKAIESTSRKDWQDTDMILEVGTERNANIIFNYLNLIKVKMFSQKNGWNKVSTIEQMPFSYKEGSLFISLKEMSWS